MTDRMEFSPKTKIAAFERAKGRCEKCKKKIVPTNGPAQYDHIVPAAIGGDNSLANCQVLCKRPCHDLKTHKTDVPEIGRTKRIIKKNAGVKRRTGKPMDGSRDSPYKKHMDGRVSRR
jgi:5-methylcytosine-specific restriction protein A